MKKKALSVHIEELGKRWSVRINGHWIVYSSGNKFLYMSKKEAEEGAKRCIEGKQSRISNEFVALISIVKNPFST